jgi:excisionase family DNA binding protein
VNASGQRRAGDRPQAKATGQIEPLYTKPEAAELLNVSVRFVSRCVFERRIRFVKVGGLIRIPHSAIVELLDQGTVQPVD